MWHNPKKSSFFGLLAGITTSLMPRRNRKPTPRDVKKLDFSTSTQRMGLRFSEHVRNTFRFKWLKKDHT